MRLFGSRCAGIYTVGYEIKLNIIYSTFLSDSQSGKFIKLLSDILKVDSNDNYINYIKEGSTIIGGTVSTSGASSASSIASTMSGLGSSSIAGFPILSSTSTIYYGDDVYVEKKKQETYNNKTGLIVGVTIGSVAFVIIVGVIIYVVVKRYQSQLQKIEGFSTTELEPKNGVSRD